MVLKTTVALLVFSPVILYCSDALAQRTYRNDEYSFSVTLSRNERICARNSHGLTITLKTAKCGGQDIGVYALFNGPLDKEFPTHAEREVCGQSPIMRTGLYLRNREWRVCALRPGSDHVDLYYFNKIARPSQQPVDWEFISVDARLRLPVSNKTHSELISLIGRIRTD